MNDPIPATGRLAGIDFGTVRIGVAVTDPDRVLASPLETYTRRSVEQDRDYFQRLAKEERLVGWVLGWPLHLSGEESLKSRETEAFGKWLMRETGLPVDYFDERFSSRFAREKLAVSRMSARKKKARIDQLAAQIMLSGYLESAAAQSEWEARQAAQASQPLGLDDAPAETNDGDTTH